MKFILTSNSYMTIASWSTQFGMVPNQLSVAFIDTAADVYNKDEAEWLQADRRTLVEFGFTVTDYTITGKTKEQLIQDLSKFDVFFVTGGNSFYLLQKANESGFTELIKENYFADKIYVGSSAGSMIVSSDLTPVQFLDDPQKSTLTNFTGLGIFNFVICPHWGGHKFKPRYQKVTDFLYDHAIPAFLLADDQYISFVDGVLQLFSSEKTS